MSGEREGRGSEGRREGAGGDSDAAVPHNVVIEENVVFLTYKCYDFYFLNIFKSPESQADFAHTSILRTEHPHPKWDLLPLSC